MQSIGFIGLGKLGMPVAEVMAEKYSVLGYDINEVNPKNITMCNSIQEIMQKTDMVFIAVQTPHEKQYGGEFPNTHLSKKNFDYSILKSVLSEVAQYADSKHTIVIISTVLPGTTRNELSLLLPLGTLLYNPYLIAMGTVKDDFKNPEMIIIGSKKGDKNDFNVGQLVKLYSYFVPHDTRYEIGTWEEAESIKIFYNTFISAKIAIVNMIQDVAEIKGNMNVDVVTNALSKSTKRIISNAYMKAGMGDGGPCHPRDNIALSWLAKDSNLGYDLFHAINKSREEQAKKMAQKLLEFNNPIVLLGTQYKPNTLLTDGSYTLLIAAFIQQAGGECYVNNHPNEYREFTYLISHEGIFEDFPFNKNSVIVDPWRSFVTNRSDLTIYAYGNRR